MTLYRSDQGSHTILLETSRNVLITQEVESYNGTDLCTELSESGKNGGLVVPADSKSYLSLTAQSSSSPLSSPRVFIHHVSAKFNVILRGIRACPRSVL